MNEADCSAPTARASTTSSTTSPIPGRSPAPCSSCTVWASAPRPGAPGCTYFARRFRVVRMDLRGFGRSTPMPRDHVWSIDELLGDVDTVLARVAPSALSWSAARAAGPSP